MKLPPDTRLHPGHTDPTTVGEEWESNAFVRLWRGLDEEGGEPCTGGGRGGHARAVGARLRRRPQGLGALARRPRRHRAGQPRDPLNGRRGPTAPSKALLGRLIDHAALFPPASMNIPDAAAEDRRARAGAPGLDARAVRLPRLEARRAARCDAAGSARPA